MLGMCLLHFPHRKQSPHTRACPLRNSFALYCFRWYSCLQCEHLNSVSPAAQCLHNRFSPRFNCLYEYALRAHSLPHPSTESQTSIACVDLAAVACASCFAVAQSLHNLCPLVMFFCFAEKAARGKRFPHSGLVHCRSSCEALAFASFAVAQAEHNLCPLVMCL